MNCQEALNLLYEIIDKEASEIDTAQVREHLGNCRHCFEVYRVETAVNELLSEKVKAVARPNATGGVEAVRNKLLTRLDQIDTDSAQNHPPTGKKPFGNTAMILAIAASVLVVGGTAIVGRGLYNHRRTFMPFEQSHWKVEAGAETPPNSPLNATRAMVIGDSMHIPLEESVDGFNLVNGHVEDLKGVRMGHFVYENGSKYVSLFAAQANELKIPEDLLDNTFTSDGLQYYSHNCRGCRLLYVRSGDMVLVSATTDKDLDLTRFLKNHRVA